MSDFCVKCSEKEAQIELLRLELWKLQQEVERLSFDLAFYEGKIINLSCNGK
jgi:hypothetical protein